MPGNTQKIAVVVTSVDIGTPVAMDETPLLGGYGRECKYSIPVLPLTSEFSLEGADDDPDTGIMPVEGSALWTSVLDVTSASDQAGQIDDLPKYLRWNTTTLDADGPDVDVILEGVQ